MLIDIVQAHLGDGEHSYWLWRELPDTDRVTSGYVAARNLEGAIAFGGPDAGTHWTMQVWRVEGAVVTGVTSEELALVGARMRELRV